MFDSSSPVVETNLLKARDVTAGATGATTVAPKFSDTLTLFQPGGGGRFCPPSQRSNVNFPRDYVPAVHVLLNEIC